MNDFVPVAVFDGANHLLKEPSAFVLGQASFLHDVIE